MRDPLWLCAIYDDRGMCQLCEGIEADDGALCGECGGSFECQCCNGTGDA